MGKRTGEEPDGTQTLVVRVCNALDLKPNELAAAIGVTRSDIACLVNERPQQLDFMGDDTWWKISEYVDRQLGMLMAVKMDVSRHMQSDREQRVLRSATVGAREKRSSPR